MRVSRPPSHRWDLGSGSLVWWPLSLRLAASGSCGGGEGGYDHVFPLPCAQVDLGPRVCVWACRLFRNACRLLFELVHELFPCCMFTVLRVGVSQHAVGAVPWTGSLWVTVGTRGGGQVWGVPGPAQRGEAVGAVHRASRSAWPREGGRRHAGVNFLGGARASRAAGTEGVQRSRSSDCPAQTVLRALRRIFCLQGPDGPR